MTIPVLNSSGDINLVERNINLLIENNDSFLIKPGTLVRIPNKDNEFSLGMVEIKGAVKEPGYYRILNGDTLFSVIKRSGGLLDNAYLEGLLFSREREKERESLH